MNRLFEALSDVDIYRPSPKPTPRAVTPRDVIQLGVRPVDVAPPLSVELPETEQLPPESAPVDVSLSDVGPLLIAEETEIEQQATESVSAEVPASDVAPEISALELETGQSAAEDNAADVPEFEVTAPFLVEEAETEQHSTNNVLIDVTFLSEFTPPLSAETAEMAQLLDAVSEEVHAHDLATPLSAQETEQLAAEGIPVRVNVIPIFSPLLAEKAEPKTETEQVSLDADLAGASPSDVTLAPSAEELEAQQHFAEAISVDVDPSQEVTLDPAPSLSAQQVETERPTVETGAVEAFAVDVAAPLSVREPEAEQHSSEASQLDLFPSEEVSTHDVTPSSSAPQSETEQAAEVALAEISASEVSAAPPVAGSETEQYAAELAPAEVFASELSSPVSAPPSELEQQSPQVVPVQVTASPSTPPLPAPESAFKDSSPKPVESSPVLPVVIRVPPESRLVALTEPNSLGAEKFRALVTRLEHLRKERELKCFQVTSSVIHEGKTLVSGNVAVTLAKYSGSQTLLIEGDLHRPTLSALFGLHNIRGLSHWWYRPGQDLGQFIYRLADLPLWFLPAGNPYDRPSDILRSARFVDAFAKLTRRFEWVVVDSTPMLPIIDVNLWSRLVDGTLLVVREGVAPVKALKQGLLALDHPKIIGVVLNDASAANQSKYDGKYYGSKKR